MIHQVLKRRRRKGGKVVLSSNYYLRYRYADMPKEEWRSTGMSQKEAAETEARKFRENWEAEAMGITPPHSLRQGAKKPLGEHLTDYLDDLESRGKTGRNNKGIHQTRSRIRRIFKECSWKFPADISSDSFSRWRSTLKEMSPTTKNHYLAEIRTFLGWMRKQARISSDPLQHVEEVQEIEDHKRQRRSFSDEELARPIGSSPKHRGLVYFTAARTGLRKQELRALEWRDVHFEKPSPHITTRASTTKNKKTQRIPLVEDLAEALKAYRGESASLNSKVFASGIPNIETFKKDLALAGIEYQDEEGRYADFHSLRQTFSTFLQCNGVSPAITKELMRHSDFRLTERAYTDKKLLPISETVQKLPTLAESAQIWTQISGKTGQNVTKGDNSELRNRDSEVIDFEQERPEMTHPDKGRRLVEVAGVEPASYGRSGKASTCLAGCLVSHRIRERAR